MSNLQGTNVAAIVVPFTSEDKFATHEDTYGKGGHRTVDTLLARNIIPIDRRKVLMTVAVIEDGKTYKLITNPTTDATTDTDWEVSGGGTGIDGKDGVGIKTMTVDETNKIKVVMTDATETDLPLTITAGASDATKVSYGDLTVAEALDKLMYTAPNVLSFTNNVNTAEIGQIIDTITFNWSLNKVVTAQSINNAVGNIDVAETTKTVSGLNLSTNKTYILTVDDGTTQTGHTATKTTNVTFSNKRYWGVSASTTLTDAEVIALSNEFASTRPMTKTLNASGGKYLYFAVPTSFGCDNSKFKVGGLANSAWELVTRAFVNASGYSTSYDIFRSTALQTGAAISVEIV